MPQAGVSVAPESLGIYDVWEEEMADEFVGDFRFPRRRVTGGRGSATGASAPTPRSAARQAVSTERAPSAGRPARNGRAASLPVGATASARNGPAPSPPEGATRAPRPVRSGSAASGFPPPAGGIPGRRTVTIRGHGAERDLAFGQARRRPSRRPYERSGFRPDRAAMWAVLLGVLLVLVAAASSHGAMRPHATHGATPHVVAVRVAAPIRTR